MRVTISAEMLEQLCVVLGTAIPVIVVAFYTYAATFGKEDTDRVGRIDIPSKWAKRVSKGGRGLLALTQVYIVDTAAPGAAPATEEMTSAPGRYELRIRNEFRIEAGRGFVTRSAVAFIFVLIPFILADSAPLAARCCAAVALGLTMWSLQALLAYTAIEIALEYEKRRRSRPPGDSYAAANLVPESLRGTWDKMNARAAKHAWRLVLSAHSNSIVIIVFWMAATVVLVASKS